jgi:hypothetical protein
MDQSPRAAPHGFSQLATSFFAYPRPGIPRAPLLRLAGVPKKNPAGLSFYQCGAGLIFCFAKGSPDPLLIPTAKPQCTHTYSCDCENVRLGDWGIAPPQQLQTLALFSTSLLALDSAAALPDKQKNCFSIFPNPNCQSAKPLTRQSLATLLFHSRREPSKITKSASSSTPVTEQATSSRQQQNADQEVPCRTLNFLFQMQTTSAIRADKDNQDRNGVQPPKTPQDDTISCAACRMYTVINRAVKREAPK